MAAPERGKYRVTGYTPDATDQQRNWLSHLGLEPGVSFQVSRLAPLSVSIRGTQADLSLEEWNCLEIVPE